MGIGDREKERIGAIQRYQDGEAPKAIYTSLGHAKSWFFKWLRRHEQGDPHWYKNLSRRPHDSPVETPREMVELVKLVRLNLYNNGAFCGDQAIRWELEQMAGVEPPSTRTIGRILARESLTHRRTGRYEPKGKVYPALPAEKPNDVHQADLVGPCYLRRNVRFYSLNSVDLATGRCAVEAMTSKGGQNTVDALWASWQRLGIPDSLQIDNEMAFYGSPAHPRGMGQLIRLCLQHGVEPFFIPLNEPWRNGVVEKFNDHYRHKFLDRTPLATVPEANRQGRDFERRHNSKWRYTKLAGKTPLACLRATKVKLRFPPKSKAPRSPLKKPVKGRYHVIRFIRSDSILNIFGEKFIAPPEAVYEYVRATINVAKQQLTLFLGGHAIDDRKYRLR